MGSLRMQGSNGCWVDVFDGERFNGNNRRLIGPAEFLGMRFREKDWGEQLNSLNVGPAAYVQCFSSRDFDRTVLWLLPNQAVERVEELQVVEGVDSLRLFDRPPFAHEGGYAAYMLWAASHLAKLKG